MADKCRPNFDCFAYKFGGCEALDDLYCAKEGMCKFYKTDEQYLSEQLEAKRKNKK